MSSDYRAEVAEILQKLTVEVATQLLRKVSEGEDLRAAIDFLRLNKVQISEHELAGTKGPSASTGDLLDSLVDELMGSSPKVRNRQ